VNPAVVAVVSDIHGNLEALEAVLDDIQRRGIQHIACLGDFVGYGASPNECVEWLQPRLEAAVVGNHDVAALGRIQLGSFNSEAAVAARWTRQSLNPESVRYLEALPDTVVWRGMRLVHATPSEPRGWHYVLSIRDAAEEFEAFEEPICLIGHSHYPGTFQSKAGRIEYAREEHVPLDSGSRYIVNVASIGQPRDGDPRAGYLVVDEIEQRLTHVRLEYPVEGAASRIVAAGLPNYLAERLKWGE
jgi:diadenosine tetraphosphatase ApaH/serine/threonine PP2A family protein phosphatase